jgi:uncharacterized protein HemX
MTYAGESGQPNPEQPGLQLPPEQVAQVQPEWPPTQPQTQPQGDPYGQQPFEQYGPPSQPFAQQPMWPAQVAPVKPKKTGLVVVSILAVLLFAAAGTFGGLYLSEKSSHDSVSAQLATANKLLADKEKSLTAALKDTETAKNEAADEKSKVESFQACHDAVAALSNAVIAGVSDAEGTELGTKMFLACA